MTPVEVVYSFVKRQYFVIIMTVTRITLLMFGIWVKFYVGFRIVWCVIPQAGELQDEGINWNSSQYRAQWRTVVNKKWAMVFLDWEFLNQLADYYRLTNQSPALQLSGLQPMGGLSWDDSSLLATLPLLYTKTCAKKTEISWPFNWFFHRPFWGFVLKIHRAWAVSLLIGVIT